MKPRLKLRAACALGWLACLAIDSTGARAEQDAVRSSVVKIYSTHRVPDLYRPWTKAAPQDSSGTGFVIEGKRIVTNAHVVSYAGQIYVQPYHSAEKFPAKVMAVSSAIDLAILSVEDESFFADRPALPLDDGLPRVKAAVNVYGYPIGGDQMSVTEGIASRIEYTEFYLDSGGLRIQIDAALNPGNSGGPAISDGKRIGVAFSGLSKAENIGYLIAVEELRTFLDDVNDGKYDGKPRLWHEFQSVDNDALRAWLKIPKEVGGCMVAKIFGDHAGCPLKERDVVTYVGSHPLDRSGNVRLGDDLEVSFHYFVPKLTHEGAVPLTVMREGQSLQLDVPASTSRPRVTPFLTGSYPDYFILGPMVFSTASAELASAVSGDKRWLNYLLAKRNPLVTRANARPEFDGEQLVIVPSPFFSHRLTKGYDSPTLPVVDTLNGTHVKNLVHLVEMLRDSKDEFLEFKFSGSEVEAFVFRRQELLDATEDILSDNGIRKQCSDDLKGVWKMAE